MITFPEKDIDRLVAMYRKAVLELAEGFAKNIDFKTPRTYSQIRYMLERLNELDSRTERWAQKNIPGIYRLSLRGIKKQLRRAGIGTDFMREAMTLSQYNVINETAIWLLLYDNAGGFLPLIRNSLDQIKGRIWTIQKQGKILASQRKRINDIVASDFFMRGNTPYEVRDKIVRELVSNKNLDEMVWVQRARRMAPDSILGNTALLPYVKIPSASAEAGYRLLRIDRYAELLARTKIGQASGMAQVNELRAHGRELFRVSNNAPLVDDACWLFIGKVIALTKEAADKFGVPHVSELPDGTPPPWHPNCRHNVEPFVMSYLTPAEIEAGFSGKLPSWSLNRPFNEVTKEWRRGGGLKELGNLNKININSMKIPRKDIRGPLPDWLSIGEKPNPYPAVGATRDEYVDKLMNQWNIDARTAHKIANKL